MPGRDQANIVIWPKSSGYSRCLGVTWNAKLWTGTFCNGVESRASSRPLPLSLSSIATTACYARAVRVHGWRMQTAHTALEKHSVSSSCLVGKGGDSVRVVRVQNNALLIDVSAVRLGQGW